VTDFALLPAVEIETAPEPDAAVIFLHGLGDDGHGWSDVVPALGLPPAMRVRVLFPHAPEMAVTINGGYVMPAWYDLVDADFNARADMAGVRTSRTHVDHLIARERKRGIAHQRIVLGGFSQGGAVALYAGLRHPVRLAGVVALSTYLVDAASLAEEAAPANRDVPVFMAHGSEDEVVRYHWGEASRLALERSGWSVAWHRYAMGHGANADEIAAVGRFIVQVLAG
jgi:phospholipase/carboxylesterase